MTGGGSSKPAGDLNINAPSLIELTTPVTVSVTTAAVAGEARKINNATTQTINLPTTNSNQFQIPAKA
jgi:hypothetical protein